jgi:hypothetical protein
LWRSRIRLRAAALRPQRELSAFQDTKGYIDVQKLTCRRLANTYQEGANLPRVWYGGLAHKHAINVPRLQQNIHDVIVYCKADQDITIIKRST